MDILSLIKSRRSIRKYLDKPVPKKEIEEILTAGIWAPSSMNRQPWRFIVVTNRETRQWLANESKKALLEFLNTLEGAKHYGEAAGRFRKRAESSGDTLFYDSPVIILVIQRHDTGSELDFGLATENMLLTAHAKGLGMCPIGLIKPLNNSGQALEKLGLKSDEKIILGLCLGYPDESPPVKNRDQDAVNWIE